MKLWFAPAKFNSRISAPRNSKDGERREERRKRKCYKTDEGEREETEGRGNRGNGGGGDIFERNRANVRERKEQETGRGVGGGGGREQPGSARCAAASCEKPIDDAAGSWTASRVSRGRARAICRIVAGPSPRSSLPPLPRPLNRPRVPYPFSLGVATRRAPFEARENKCTPGRAAI